MPELSLLKARSTWVLIFAVIGNVAAIFGIQLDLVPQEAAEQVMQLITVLGAAWIYVERVTGRKKLTAPWNPPSSNEELS